MSHAVIQHPHMQHYKGSHMRMERNCPKVLDSSIHIHIHRYVISIRSTMSAFFSARNRTRSIRRSIHRRSSGDNTSSLVYLVRNICNIFDSTYIFRALNAFSYYGLVLFTTELFQSSDSCHGGGGSHDEPTCPLECHRLNTDDYLDLLWTTLAEFPGLLLTASIIEYLGRRRTMALEFGVFSIFTAMLFFCLNRYDYWRYIIYEHIYIV